MHFVVFLSYVIFFPSFSSKCYCFSFDIHVQIFIQQNILGAITFSNTLQKQMLPGERVNVNTTPLALGSTDISSQCNSVL